VPRIYTHIDMICSLLNNGYLDGQHHLTEMSAELNITMRELNDVFSRFRDVLVLILQ
jgi:hypothetical protein